MNGRALRRFALPVQYTLTNNCKIMKYKTNAVCSLLMLILGVIFLCYDSEAVSKAVLVLCGVAFFVPGLLLVCEAVFGRKDEKSFSKGLRAVCGLAAVAFGIVIWCMPDTFIPVVAYLLGALLVVASIYHLAMITRSRRYEAYPGWMIAGPLLVLIAGICLLTVDYFHHYGIGYENNVWWLIFITGIGMIIFGVNGLIMASRVYSRLRKDRKAARIEQHSARAAEEPARISEPQAPAVAETAEPNEVKDEPAAKSDAADEKPISPDYQGH